MKILKKTILGLSLLSVGLLSAQETVDRENLSMKNMLKIGFNAGVSIPAENVSATVGFDLAYQYLVTPNFGLGLASGYNHYFGKNNDGIENNSFGVVPLAALLRYYPNKTGFYFGTDLGYGFITGDDYVAENAMVMRPDGGFYLRPEVGYHNRDWNFSLKYQKVLTGDNGEIGSRKYNAGSLGVGVGYNIPLGK